jgi:hypothetical protein
MAAPILSSTIADPPGNALSDAKRAPGSPSRRASGQRIARAYFELAMRARASRAAEVSA